MLTTAPLAQRLLVAYVGQRGASKDVRQQRHVKNAWSLMQVEYSRWSLRCLLVLGDDAADASELVYKPSPSHDESQCSELAVKVDADNAQLRKGQTVAKLLVFLGGGNGGSTTHTPPRFDFVLKAELSTLICFTMMTDLLEAATLRHQGGGRLYLGQLETCTRVQHAGLVRRGDELLDEAFLDDVLNRKDAACYPPYMQGLGYVLGAQLVRDIGAMATRGTLKVYANDDVMVGAWLLGHEVHRARLVAKEYLDMWYQTSLSQCFPFYMNQKVPSNEHFECAYFYSATGLCFSPKANTPSALVAARASSASSSLLKPLSAPPGSTTATAASASDGATTTTTLASLLAKTTVESAASSAVDEPTLSALRRDVTFGIKVVTKLRNHVQFILHSIHQRYPGVKIIVADDEYVGVGGEEWRRMHELMADYNVSYVQSIPRSGLSAGRNSLVTRCSTKYMVLLDDDVFLTASSKVELLYAQLEANPDVQIAAGAYSQYSSKEASTYVHDYSLLFAASTTEADAWYAYTPTLPAAGQCYPVHGAHNFFMARTDALRQHPWHPKMSIFEHEHFFFQLFLAKSKILSCPHVSVFHYRAPNLHDERYMSNSLRFKEAAYARHFCHAFPTLKKLYAPFWTYDCVQYLLCPRFKNGGQCRSMADPYLITRGAVGLGARAGASGAKGGNADADGDSNATAVAAAGSGPQPVLLVGEGAAMEVLSRLFVDSDEYMLWREPRTWKVVSHMSDELYAATVAALLKCELSAQQLLILHSEAPDYDPQAETKGSGFLSGAPPVTLAEKEHVEWLQTLYAERRIWRKGDKRFCAPGVATAALVSRFSKGVPPELVRLPVKVLALLRHPSDVVIERLQAKPIKGMAAYPECSVATIGECAEKLCGENMRMLDALEPMDKEGGGSGGGGGGGGRYKLLKWESLTKRRNRMSQELHSWFGMRPQNSSAVIAKLADGIEAQQKAFNSLAKSYPISLQSLRLVEQKCAALMHRVGFLPTADVQPDATTGSTQKRRHAKRFASKKKKKKEQQQQPDGENADGAATAAVADAGAREPLLLLRRRPSAKSPTSPAELLWCPVRLTGAEGLAKLFVSLDAPKASRAPPCFPGAKDDVCPVPRSAAWMPSRWGAYPFEVTQPEMANEPTPPAPGAARSSSSNRPPRTSIPGGGFSFAFVRNPWDRLASAYAKLIAIEDQRTSIHRTWIREMHNLHEKEPIGFTHFVRWVVAQEPSSMHRAWRPYTRTCHFDTVSYSFIGRFETFEQDVERMMTAVGLTSERAKRMWQRANTETRPLVPHDHPDQLLRLHHLYYSDDERDLIEIVRQKYLDDVELFGYTFPTNETIAPWERAKVQ